MFGLNEEKKKLSIDFELSNYNVMGAFAKKHKMGNSSVINYLVEHFLQLAPDIKRKLAKAVYEALEEYKAKYAECEPYEEKEIEKQIGILRDLEMFFTNGKGYSEEEKMKKVVIDGGYAIFPSDWVCIDEENAHNCKYVGVIEIQNGKEYNVPHFVFFSEFPINDIRGSLEDDLYLKIELKYPKFKNVRAMQVEPLYDEDNNLLNGELWRKAPTIGTFTMPTYGVHNSFPAGAMIVRNEPIDGEEAHLI